MHYYKFRRQPIEMSIGSLWRSEGRPPYGEEKRIRFF